MLSSHFKCDTNGDGRGIRISNKPCAQRTPPGKYNNKAVGAETGEGPGTGAGTGMGEVAGDI